MADELFCKRLPMMLRSSDREDRKVQIQVAIEMHSATAPVHHKELVVRLTDEKDLFFLYTLQLGEEDFQSLKAQQGLLVDFGAFPQRFVDLLQMVLQEEHKEAPKFVVDLVCAGSSGMGNSMAVLNVIETNPFKHLTHLALKFLPGTDSDVKKYLANCLKTLKEQNGNLLERFEHTEGDLSSQLRAAREALATRTTELNQLKTEWANKISTITAKNQEEFSNEREKALNLQTATQQRFDRERRELEQMHSKGVKQIESRLYELEGANKELADRKYVSEATIRELRSKLGLLEEEQLRNKAELSALRQNNSGLDAEYHEQDKLVHQLRTRLAVTEQELKDKAELLKRTSDSGTTEKEQRHKVEDDLDREKRRVSELKLSLKTMTEELTKGNEIIKKLQNDIKNYHSKLKLRNQITTEQEKLLGEKNREMEEMRRDLETTKTGLQNKNDENTKLNEQLETTVQKLDESRQLLKTNENVIQWLNKQVTEVQMNHHRPAAGPFEMNTTTSTICTPTSYRQHHPPQHNYGAPYSSGAPSRMSSSLTSLSSQLQHHAPRPQPHVQYQPGVPRKSGLPMPLAKSSPIGTIPEEHSPHASPPHLATQARTKQSDMQLDPKYLQRSEDQPLRTTATGRVSPTPFYFPLRPAAPSTAPAALPSGPPPPGTRPHHARLSKDIITPRATAPSGTRPPSQQPPLASAYFTGAAKVS